jgi:hypothetical protein
MGLLSEAALDLRWMDWTVSRTFRAGRGTRPTAVARGCSIPGLRLCPGRRASPSNPPRRVDHRGPDDPGLVGDRVQNAERPIDDGQPDSRGSALPRGRIPNGGWLREDSLFYSSLSLLSFSLPGRPRLHRLTTSRTKSTCPMGSARKVSRAAEVRRFSSAPWLMARSGGATYARARAKSSRKARQGGCRSASPTRQAKIGCGSRVAARILRCG